MNEENNSAVSLLAKILYLSFIRNKAGYQSEHVGIHRHSFFLFRELQCLFVLCDKNSFWLPSTQSYSHDFLLVLRGPWASPSSVFSICSSSSESICSSFYSSGRVGLLESVPIKMHPFKVHISNTVHNLLTKEKSRIGHSEQCVSLTNCFHKDVCS